LLRAIAADVTPVALDAPVDDRADSVTRSRLALGAGCVCALALVGLDATVASARARDAERLAESLEARHDGALPPDEHQVHMGAAVEEIATLVTRELGPAAPWAGVLGAVTSELGHDIRLTRVSGDRSAERSDLRLEGELTATTAVDAQTMLAEVVRRLRSHPLFDAVAVPAIDQETVPQGARLTFDVRLTLKEIAPAWVAEVSP
jgi:hypothetical protein